MSTTLQTQYGKLRHWHKFGILVVIAILLLICGRYAQNDYLEWGGALIFVIATWYGILSVLQLMDKWAQ